MKLLIAGGGTGGHIFPGIAIAKTFMAQAPNPRLIFVGTPLGMEKKLIPSHGFSLHLIPGAGFKGKSGWQKLRALLLLPWSFFAALRILLSFNPDIVLGVGGYASFAVCLVAKLIGLPIIIEEQNAIPGFSNRLLGKLANWVAITFPGSEKYFPTGKASCVGLPMRAEILQIPPADFQQRPFTILIHGGSQGASQINQTMIAALPLLPKSIPLRFIHQTGERDLAVVQQAYAKQGCEARVVSFIEDMAAALNQAHLVIARAGASIMEIAAAGRPSLLIPYPFAADNHQEANAAVFASHGAALRLDPKSLSAEMLATHITQILQAPQQLSAMGQAALQLGKRHATTQIMQAVLRLTQTPMPSEVPHA